MEFKQKKLLEQSTDMVLHLQFEISALALNALSKERRIIIQSHFYNGKSAKETVPQPNVMEFLGRVSKKLSKNLRKHSEWIEKKDLEEKVFENLKRKNSHQKVGQESPRQSVRKIAHEINLPE